MRKVKFKRLYSGYGGSLISSDIEYYGIFHSFGIVSGESSAIIENDYFIDRRIDSKNIKNFELKGKIENLSLSRLDLQFLD